MATLTRNALRQYRAKRREAEILRKRIQDSASPVTDLVRGSMAEHPYLETSITIDGTSPKRVQRLRKRVEALEADGDAIRGMVDALSDSYIRTAITLRYLDGHSWKRVAAEMGGYCGSDAVRKAVERFLCKG